MKTDMLAYGKMNILMIVVGALCAIVLVVGGIFKLRNYYFNKRSAKTNWLHAQKRREAWFRENAWHSTVPSLKDVTGETFQYLARMPIGQWHMRVEAGAYQLWLLKKTWVTDKDNELLEWYFDMTFSDVEAKDPKEDEQSLM